LWPREGADGASRAMKFAETRGVEIGKDRQPLGAATPCFVDCMRDKRTTHPGSDVLGLDKELVQIERVRLLVVRT